MYHSSAFWTRLPAHLCSATGANMCECTIQKGDRESTPLPDTSQNECTHASCSSWKRLGYQSSAIPTKSSVICSWHIQQIMETQHLHQHTVRRRHACKHNNHWETKDYSNNGLTLPTIMYKQPAEWFLLRGHDISHQLLILLAQSTNSIIASKPAAPQVILRANTSCSINAWVQLFTSCVANIASMLLTTWLWCRHVFKKVRATNV